MPETLLHTDLHVQGLYRFNKELVWASDAEVLKQVPLTVVGIMDDRHSGVRRTRRAYESKELEGLNVVNDRQLSLVDSADMLAIAEELDLPIDLITERTEEEIDTFMARQLAANILLDGMHDTLNDVAAPGRLMTFLGIGGVSSVIRLTEYNEPCRKPVTNLLHSLGAVGISIDEEFDSFKKRFKKEAAASRRGWLASVYSHGSVAIGNKIAIHPPVEVPNR